MVDVGRMDNTTLENDSIAREDITTIQTAYSIIIWKNTNRNAVIVKALQNTAYATETERATPPSAPVPSAQCFHGLHSPPPPFIIFFLDTWKSAIFYRNPEIPKSPPPSPISYFPEMIGPGCRN